MNLFCLPLRKTVDRNATIFIFLAAVRILLCSGIIDNQSGEVTGPFRNYIKIQSCFNTLRSSLLHNI